MEQKGIDLTITYNERSAIGATKRVTEMAYLLIETNTEYMEERVELFKKTIRRAFSLFKKSGVHSVNMEFSYGGYYDHFKPRFALIYQNCTDNENGIFEFYTYSLTMPTTDIDKVSKQVALKRIFAMVDKLTEKALAELREEATA